jgi:hypothetical protein
MSRLRNGFDGARRIATLARAGSPHWGTFAAFRLAALSTLDFLS